ncbi:MAG: class I SAM-dependent methyltransferase [Candidatus Bathyarchaeia archaeon]
MATDVWNSIGKEEIVRKGYDKIASQYDEYRDLFNNETELNEFMSLVRPGGHILDAGCGSGVVARALVDNGFQVTGIDISQKMIDIAKHRIPEAEFIIGDMAALEFDNETFDGVVSTYAVFHIPRTKHFSLFLEFHRILKKGGALLFSVGSKGKGTDGVWEWEEFQSVPMYWSYYPPSKTVELLKSADFQIVFSRNVEQTGETHFWILAKAL